MWKFFKRVLRALAYDPDPVKKPYIPLPEPKYNFTEFPMLPDSVPGCYMKPEIELKFESCVIKAPDQKWARWTVEVQRGWPIYKFIGEGTWEERYDDRRWARNINGDPTQHHLIGETGLVEGMAVIWKGSPFDYVWNDGVIRKHDGVWYVESSTDSKHWGNPKFDMERNCWVNDGACYLPNMPIFT